MPGIVKLAAAAGLIGGFFLLFQHLDAVMHIKNFLRWMEKQGPWGMMLFAAFYILAPALFFPITLLTASAGVLLGFWWGYAFVAFAAPASAILTFLLGRYLMRAWVVKKTRNDKRYKAIDEAVAEDGWKIVTLARLSLIIPFSFLNYFLGATKIRVKEYAVASWIAMLPGSAVFVYAGALVGNIAALEDRERPPGEWVFYGAGLLAASCLCFYMARLARQALQRHMKTPPGAEK